MIYEPRNITRGHQVIQAMDNHDLVLFYNHGDLGIHQPLLMG